ncbi:DNA helicase-2 / ATP-dependent DNA helicase PcrA [Nitrosospira multiformis]|uniref:DNA 3'-5' helicase II n=1 Tax=Nitrosospira multiformis TaxID=1231 RepID=A0A1I0C099_9PROT|nr:UvrD-helicase domain-containing protein [Nitrosospira multiformis]SET12750.1 DNA helicase-2 / ATP-dependent DNA helicase PcrA [Nitrosospira multiformis]
MSEKFSPALLAARAADERVAECLRDSRSFLLEAGAGAGKTYSLVETLRYLLISQGEKLRCQNQRIACITYTNAATGVINSRIDGNQLVFTDTIHAFCWSLIKGFQSILREKIAVLPAWQEKLCEEPSIEKQRVEYDLGHRRINGELISLHHDDVLALTAALMPSEKFKSILAGKYPFILVDEYQDTSREIMNAIKENLLGRAGGPLIGFFGDHWQRIYDETCGHVNHDALTEIGKGANFRSSISIVKVLNNIRPALPQAVKDESFIGSAVVYHTNTWAGSRRTGAGGGHWKDDLPADIAHQYLCKFIEKLKTDGWDFAADKTKILMLTHNTLALEQGYASLAKALRYPDKFIKKEDEYISFFADKLEPACGAYQRGRYGEMFSLLGDAAPKLISHDKKVRLSKIMNELIALRHDGTIGQLIDHICANHFPRLPEAIMRRENEAAAQLEKPDEEVSESVKLTRQLRKISYQEMIALDQFIDGHTPFATKHSVKGDEFENVLVVLGRGWNKYNFDQYLEWEGSGSVPVDKQDVFERNRNLFYVSCSRPTTRLALLFTQKLSCMSLQTLKAWFGPDSVHSFAP